jgi:hypothetical protein
MHSDQKNNKLRYRQITDFLYLLCKMEIIRESRIPVSQSEGNFDHVHDAMRYILYNSFLEQDTRAAGGILKTISNMAGKLKYTK